MKERRVFFIAIAVSALLHFYFITEGIMLPTFNSDYIEIPVTFIPGAERDITPDLKKTEEKQISVPEDRPETKGYYSAAGRDRLMKRYLEMIAEDIDKRKFSPAESEYYGLIGNVTIGFDITAEGLYHGISILSPSGDELLDKTALNAVADSSGKIKRPPATGKQVVRVYMVVKYQYGL